MFFGTKQEIYLLSPIRKLQKQMPWLWAIRKEWRYDDAVEVKYFGTVDLDTTWGNTGQPETTTFNFHIVSDNYDKVVSVDTAKYSKRASPYEALTQLKMIERVDLSEVQHLVHCSNNFTQIFKLRRGQSFSAFVTEYERTRRW